MSKKDSLQEGRELASEAGMSQYDFDRQNERKVTGRPQKYYAVTRIIKAQYEVVARNKEEVKTLIQDPHTVTIIKETIKLIP